HLDVGLAFRRHREPAKVPHPRVRADLEAELLRVELLRRVLVEDEDGRVADTLNHRDASVDGLNWVTQQAMCPTEVLEMPMHLVLGSRKLDNPVTATASH